MDILKKYVDLFNKNDEETYTNLIDNSLAYEWLSEEIPIFECPDKEIEESYYFRWWTYRKHLKKTVDGYIVSEFLPQVPWGGIHNEINAAVGHHLFEGRWLKNSPEYQKLADCTQVIFDKKGNNKVHQEQSWQIRHHLLPEQEKG